MVLVKRAYFHTVVPTVTVLSVAGVTLPSFPAECRFGDTFHLEVRIASLGERIVEMIDRL